MIRNFAGRIFKSLPFAAVALNLYVPLFLAGFIALHGVEDVHAAAPATEQAAPKVQATVKNVDAAGNLLTIRVENRATILAVTPQTKIGTADGRSLTLADLQKNDEVKVAWVENAGKAVASEVVVILPAQFREKGAGGGKGEGKGQNKGQNRG